MKILSKTTKKLFYTSRTHNETLMNLKMCQTKRINHKVYIKSNTIMEIIFERCFRSLFSDRNIQLWKLYSIVRPNNRNM